METSREDVNNNTLRSPGVSGACLILFARVCVSLLSLGVSILHALLEAADSASHRAPHRTAHTSAYTPNPALAMSSTCASEDEFEAEMVRRAAAAAAAKKAAAKPARPAAQQTKKRDDDEEDDDDNKGNTKGRKQAQGKGKAKGKQQQQQSTRSDSDSEESSAKGRGKAAPPMTQYEAWKSRQSQKRDADASSDDDAPRKVTMSRAQLREAAAAAPLKQRESKAARVPIKVERAKATRQADIDSGVAGALRTLAIKKQQQKQRKKQAKKNAAAEDSEEEKEDDEDASDSDNDEDQTEAAADNAATAKVASDSESESESEPDSSPAAAASETYDTVEERMAAYRSEHAIHVVSTDESVVTSDSLDADPMYYPITEFASLTSEFGLSDALVSAATGVFARPTPIQAQCWPVLLGGQDVIGVASTGSGKTVAFLLPAMFYLMQVRAREAKKAEKARAAGLPLPTATNELAPRVLVLAPTRELAVQIHEVALLISTKLTAATGGSASSTTAAGVPAITAPIQTYVVFGGSSLEAQLSSLRSLASLDLLVATPGRLLKHLGSNSFTIGRVGYFVLDEADRMLDLGFEAALRDIVARVPANRQTCLFSATWESSAQTAAAAFLARGADRTIKVVIGSEDLTAAKSVTQVVEVVDRRAGKREKRLVDLLEDEYHRDRSNRVLIFVLYKKEAGLLTDHLLRKGFKAAAISGDRTQAQRLEALERFRSGEIPILVATDVAARGLDVKNVSHVINFSLGLSVEQYIHRVGRCGRAGATGLAHTFVVDYDAPHTPQLVRVLEESGHPVSADLREMADRADRQAAKHADTPTQQLKGDAYFGALKSGALTRNVHLAKQLAKEAEEADIESRIFGDDDDDAHAGGVQKGKKVHAIHAGRKGGGGGGGGGKGQQQRKGKGRPH